jgi:hypothetical protein
MLKKVNSEVGPMDRSNMIESAPVSVTARATMDSPFNPSGTPMTADSEDRRMLSESAFHFGRTHFAPGHVHRFIRASSHAVTMD